VVTGNACDWSERPVALAYPEVVCLSQQMASVLVGRRIAGTWVVDVGWTAGQWRYGSIDQLPATFADRLDGGRVTAVDRVANCLFLCTDRNTVLALGYVSGRITHHGPHQVTPARSCLRVVFDDGSQLAVVVSLWGLIRALSAEEVPSFVARWYGPALEPNSAAFTWAGFRAATAAVADPRLSAKKFLHAFEPGYCVSGIDSAYALEILHHARIHPKRALSSLTGSEQRACYASVNRVAAAAVQARGRASEVDLYGEPGGYLPHVGAARAGQPCLECGTPIEQFRFEGGACYACPACQPAGGRGR
jgi:formamidopyrimidine-DNA glycosylase